MQPAILSMTWQNFDQAVASMKEAIRGRILTKKLSVITAPLRGGLPLAVALSHHTGISFLPYGEAPLGRQTVIWVDDIVSTGKTLVEAVNHHIGRDIHFFSWCLQAGIPDSRFPRGVRESLFSVITVPRGTWVVFPWEDKAKAEADCRSHLQRRAKEVQV